MEPLMVGAVFTALSMFGILACCMRKIEAVERTLQAELHAAEKQQSQIRTQAEIATARIGQLGEAIGALSARHETHYSSLLMAAQDAQSTMAALTAQLQEWRAKQEQSHKVMTKGIEEYQKRKAKRALQERRDDGAAPSEGWLT